MHVKLCLFLRNEYLCFVLSQGHSFIVLFKCSLLVDLLYLCSVLNRFVFVGECTFRCLFEKQKNICIVSLILWWYKNYYIHFAMIFLCRILFLFWFLVTKFNDDHLFYQICNLDWRYQKKNTESFSPPWFCCFVYYQHTVFIVRILYMIVYIHDWIWSDINLLID